MISAVQWWTLALALVFQFFATALALVSPRLTPRDYYYTSTLTMCLTTGVLVGAHSAWAALTGALAVGFGWCALTEPARRRRYLSLVRQLRTLKGKPRP